jgi:hypothetical protein
MWLNKNTGHTQSNPPWFPSTWVHPKIINEQYSEWVEVPDDFSIESSEVENAE